MDIDILKYKDQYVHQAKCKAQENTNNMLLFGKALEGYPRNY